MRTAISPSVAMTARAIPALAAAEVAVVPDPWDEGMAGGLVADCVVVVACWACVSVGEGDVADSTAGLHWVFVGAWLQPD